MLTNKYVSEGAYKNFHKKAITHFGVYYYMERYCFINKNIFKKKEEEIFSSTGSQYQTG